MLTGQAVLIGITGVTLVATAWLIAPPIFSKHLAEAGITSSNAQMHITDAFISAFDYSLIFSGLASLGVAGVIAWYFVRRIVQPIIGVTQLAETLASGDSDAHAQFDRSISELDRLSTALEGLSHDLSASQQAQARMLGDLAHELRTPIATVSAIVDGIEDGVIEPTAQTWQTIRHQLERVTRLSHDVRDVSQDSEKSLSTLSHIVDPKVLAASAFGAWEAKMNQKGIRFLLETEKTLPSISADPQRIGQILANLLENALRFTPAHGEIAISVRATSNEVLFIVRDSGQGIDSQQLPHIFERLFRGDKARQSGESGSGLGLTIARSIAESHQGSLVAQSEGKDLGATFTLALPIIPKSTFDVP